jgi:hypothetical protein
MMFAKEEVKRILFATDFLRHSILIVESQHIMLVALLN